jgi:hypothetical protein
MYRIHLFDVFVFSILVTGSVLSSAGPAAAAVPATHCYRLDREELGTVLPSGWRAANEATCGGQPMSSAGAPDPARAAFDRCYLAARRELGAVMPERGVGIHVDSCTAPAHEALTR